MNSDEMVDSENPFSNDLDSTLNDTDSEPLFTSENLNILNDIDMQITVEIGRAKMKISELLNLKKGSVIELAQSADEPLQIFANEKLIAKGIIVSTNGNYCVKIT